MKLLGGLPAVERCQPMAATHILVVEDEFLIALDIAGVLEQAGLTVIGPAGNVRDALEAAIGQGREMKCDPEHGRAF